MLHHLYSFHHASVCRYTMKTGKVTNTIEYQVSEHCNIYLALCSLWLVVEMVELRLVTKINRS